MFALTVEKLSHYEYKPTKKEELKAQLKAERREFGRISGEESPRVYRSPIAARRKTRLSQILGMGTTNGRRGSLTSQTSCSTNTSSSSSNSSTSGVYSTFRDNY